MTISIQISFLEQGQSKTIIVNQNFCQIFSQIYIISKYIKKEIEKKTNHFLWNNKKIKVPRHFVPFRRGRIGSLDGNTQLNSMKIKYK